MPVNLQFKTWLRAMFLTTAVMVAALTHWTWLAIVGLVLVLAEVAFSVWWEEAYDKPEWMENLAEWLDDKLETALDWLDS